MNSADSIVAGQRFGKLVSIRGERIANQRGHRRLHWWCKCDCGEEKRFVACNLVNGHSKSCGCARHEGAAAARTTHGATRGRSRLPEYKIWTDIKSRCLNEKRPAFADYGGRGITICARWRDSFEAFFADMGPRPSPAHEIDREDNDGHYEQGNCRWVIRAVNARNRRNSVRLTDEQVRVIRSDPRHARLIADQFGLQRHYVSMLKTRKVYSHVA